MSERPILMSAPMVRALLSGLKTQTRRAVKSQPHDGAKILVERYHPTIVDRHGEEQPGEEIYGAYSLDGEWGCKCPYGQPLDKLWVRETGWERPERTPKMMRDGADTWERYYYDADGLGESDHEQFKAWGFKRRPSIFMPRWASRITLEITGIRVERLQDISKADCTAEGMEGLEDVHAGWHESYAQLVDKLNGNGFWAANPWVWCISFRKPT